MKLFTALKTSLASAVLLLAIADLQAQIFTNLHTFAGTPTDGATPGGGLVLHNGIFYGATADGGVNTDFGAIFKINTNGTGYAVIKSFVNANSDGISPQRLAVSGDGTIFGATSRGGGVDGGVLFGLNTDGSGFRLIKEFPPMSFEGTNTDGSRPNAGLRLDGGTLYGTTLYGGDFAGGVIFKIETNGNGFSVLKHFAQAGGDPHYGTTTNADGVNSYSMLLLDGDTLYGTAEDGGLNGSGTVFKINTNGSNFTVLRQFTLVIGQGPNADGKNPGGSLALSGNTLFGTTMHGGQFGNGTIFKVNIDGAGFEVLKHFSDNCAETNLDGAYATWGLTISGDTLYGTTQNGGTKGYGVLFSIKTNGSNFTVWHNFGMDSKDASASVAVLGDQIFGATRQGGTNGAGSIYSFQMPSPSSPMTGALQVVLSPTGAVNAGAQWNLDGGAYQANGAVLTGIPFGNHVLSFKTASGWEAPLDKFVAIAAGVTNSETGAYTTTSISSGALQVTINPADAVIAGARWKVDGGALQLSGTVVSGLAVGAHTVCFNSIAGWIAPNDLTVSVDADATSLVAAVYTNVPAQNGALIVTLGPAGAVSAGAQWQVDGCAFLNSGSVITNLSVGSHTICCKAVSGWSTPADRVVSITAGATNSAAVTYTALETTKPTLTLTAPKAGQRWSNEVFVVTGTARDNAGIATVILQLNGVWTNATTANDWTNWSFSMSLQPGTNTVRAFAIDTSGNNSATNTVSLLYVVADRLAVLRNGSGTFSPNLNGLMLQISNRFKITAKASTGFAFTNWTSSLDGLLTNKPALTFVMKSNLSLTANFVDIARPVIAVTNIKTGGRVSNAVFTVKGSAKDNVGVTAVQYSINGSDWSNAVSANVFSNWNATIPLNPALNTLRVFAMDAAGRKSLTNSVVINYVVSGPIVVQTNGRGTVSPNLNGAMLAIGVRYSITAKPATGFAFSNWTTPTGTSNSATLPFIMQSNLTLTANFRDITRPVNVVTIPTVGQKWSNAVFTASGKATDNVGVSDVLFKLNSGGWSNCIFAANHTNWSTPNLTLLSGSNYIQAFAVDAAGNRSLTNGVRLTYLVQPVADWAPDSLNGLIAHVSMSNGVPSQIGFDVSTFAQSGVDSENFGTGTYTYSKSSATKGELALSFASPPGQSNDVGEVELVFTNHYAGYFTNTDSGDFGGINLVIATNLIPGSLAGRTVTAIASDLSETNVLKLVNSTGFTKTPPNHGGAGFSSGTYTFARLSPVSGLLTLTFTNAVDVGAVVYVQTTFTNSSAGAYSVSSFNGGVFQETSIGRFNVK